MPVTSTEIQVKFRRPPYNLFGFEPFENVNLAALPGLAEQQDHGHGGRRHPGVGMRSGPA
jgi:hypothetical protein